VGFKPDKCVTNTFTRETKQTNEFAGKETVKGACHGNLDRLAMQIRSLLTISVNINNRGV
ncbi:MAG: hypothetical protein PHS72_05755, partial [Lachnospiraceae bacterium]|nr:hypothetical protein [Lachnospiraceae bacterium]